MFGRKFCKDLWAYVQGIPHPFSVGGLLYNQVQRDLGLTEGKHYQLPCLSGKVREKLLGVWKYCKDLRAYVQGIPHLFSVGGLLYNQVQRDLGLTKGKHCQLQCLPGKVREKLLGVWVHIYAV